MLDPVIHAAGSSCTSPAPLVVCFLFSHMLFNWSGLVLLRHVVYVKEGGHSHPRAGDFYVGQAWPQPTENNVTGLGPARNYIDKGSVAYKALDSIPSVQMISTSGLYQLSCDVPAGIVRPPFGARANISSASAGV